MQSANVHGDLVCAGDITTMQRTEIGAGTSGISVNLPSAQIKGQVMLSGSVLHGALNAHGSIIEGGFFCGGDKTTQHRTQIGRNQKNKIAVMLAGARIKGQVAFCGAKLDGGLTLEKADVGGGLLLQRDPTTSHRTQINVEYEREAALSVCLAGAKLKAHVDFSEAVLGGEINGTLSETASGFSANQSAIRGDFSFEAAQFGHYLDLSGTVIVEEMDLSHARIAVSFHA